MTVSAVAITFLHEYQSKYTQEYLTHYKKYNVIIENRNQDFEDLILKLEQGTEREKAFAREYRQIGSESSASLKEYHAIKKQLLDDQKVIGYSSLKNFLLGIGLPIFSLVVCLFYFQLVIKSAMPNLKRKFYIISSGTFLLCAAYWVSWSFIYTTNSKGEYDFEHIMYDIALYGLPLLVVAGSYFIFKHYNSIEAKFRSMINLLFKGYYEDLEDNKLIDPNKDEEYRRYRMKLTEKVLEHE